MKLLRSRKIATQKKYHPEKFYPKEYQLEKNHP